MDSFVVGDTRTVSGDDSERKTKYPMLQPFWLTAGYIITGHGQSAASKTESGMLTIPTAHTVVERRLRQPKITN